MAAQGLLACLLHEVGHCMMLWQLGNDIKHFSLTIFGAQIMPDKMMSYRNEFLVAAAGPAVNLLLAYFFCAVPGCQSFAGVNLALGVFNLLPVRELDGARMLRCLLLCVVSGERALWMIRCVSFTFTAVFAMLGVLLAVQNQNLTMLLMALWMLKRPGDEKTL